MIERERPDALLGTLGGQTALNLAKALHEDGTLERFGVELIGVDYDAIQRAEDRELFRETMIAPACAVPRSAIVTSIAEAERAIDDIGLPLIVRPGVHARRPRRRGRAHEAEFHERVSEGPEREPDQPGAAGAVAARLGRVRAGGDARPQRQRARRLLDREHRPDGRPHRRQRHGRSPADPHRRQYQVLRDQALAVIRAVGVETGGSNIQFAVNPRTARWS